MWLSGCRGVGERVLSRDDPAFEEGLDRGPALHPAALVGTVVVVGREEDVEIGLELGKILVPGLAALDAEVLVEQGAVEAFEVAVALRAADPGGAVSDAFELEEELVGVLVGPAAEFAAVVGKDGFDGGLVFLEEGQDVVVGMH